jgi:adenine-specific DNA-methyltransferase
MKTATPPSLSKNLRKKFEYILCYAKKELENGLNGGTVEGGDMPLLNEINSNGTLRFTKESVNFKIPDGTYRAGAYDRVVLEEDLIIKEGKALNDLVLSGHFKWTQPTLNEEIKNGTEFWVKTEKFAIRYARQGERIKLPSNIISKDECGVGTNEDAQKDILALFDKKVMDYPKPVSLLKYLVNMITKEYDIILEFFSGSASTAHAVMQLNAEDGGNRKFIMVQLPEKCDEKSEAYKAGYKTICDIGQERIRRAGKQIKEEGGLTAQDLDVGFRVLRLDSSNMQEVYYNPSAMTQDILAMTVDNVKADRTPLDLLFQVMLDLGIELSAKIEENVVNGKTYYAVNGNDIIACFDDDIDNDVITAIAKQNPLYAVFKDKSFATDSVGINNEQLFKTYSPSTVVKVI